MVKVKLESKKTNKIFIITLISLLIFSIMWPACATMEGDVDPATDFFLSIVGLSQVNYYSAESTTEWNHKLDSSVTYFMETDTLSYIDYSTAYFLVPSSEYPALASKINDLGSMRESYKSTADGYRNIRIDELIRNKVGSTVSVTVKNDWQRGSSVDNIFTVRMPGVDVYESYVLVGVGCSYRTFYDWGYKSRFMCEVSYEDIGVYDCGDCQADGYACALSDTYLSTDASKHAYITQIGSNKVCLAKGVEHGFCEGSSDCASLVTSPPTTVTRGGALYSYSAARCEEVNPVGTYTDAINFINDRVTNSVGSCEYGADSHQDCEASGFGMPSDYYMVTKDGKGYSSFSGWGVLAGECLLGECENYADCYSLYRSIHYDCVPSNVDDGHAFYCKMIKWTSGEIQQHCEEFGGMPTQGKAWFIDSEGECYLDTPKDSECSVSTDCPPCPMGKFSHCVVIKTAQGDVGTCECLEDDINYPDPLCGDGYCHPSEELTCPIDCHCGNKICESEYGEDRFNCPSDCFFEPPPPVPDYTWWIIGGVAFIMLSGTFLIAGIGAILLLRKRRK